jgi:hypothetical protein
MWKAVYCLFSEEHTLMFGTDVLNKKSMVGQVRQRFTKGQSQEMRWKYILKVSTTKSVPFVPDRPGQINV